MMVGDRQLAVSLVFTSAPPFEKQELTKARKQVLDESGLLWPNCASSVLCCVVKTLPLTHKGGHHH